MVISQRPNVPGYSYAENKIITTFSFISSVLDAGHIEFTFSAVVGSIPLFFSLKSAPPPQKKKPARDSN
jgi:hypothetical protein